jgi:type IX secretion system PorP/SprF family membrane protein
MKKRLLLAVIGFLAGFCSSGQDIHFSQFENSPFHLNPSLTGDFNGTFRVVGNYRTQWRSVTVPYSTLSLAGDMPFEKHKVGAVLMHDQAGDSRLTTTSFHGSYAYPLVLDSALGLSFVPGISIGITTMSIDYDALNFDNQWNGVVFDPSLNASENFARSSRAYFSMNIGGRVVRVFNRNKEFSFGAALFNVGQPRQSFFDDGFVRLDPRTNLHATYRFPHNDDWIFAPSMLWMAQGTYREWDLGGTAEYILESKPWMFRTVFGGLYYRTGDAGFAMAGMRYDNWKVAVSYDINTSNLRPASNGRGGFELSVIYIAPPGVQKLPAKKVCPDFI